MVTEISDSSQKIEYKKPINKWEKKYYSSVKLKLNNTEIQLIRLAITKKTNTIPQIGDKDGDKM